MKKLALTSLLAVFAVSGAHAAINDNPLYRPVKGMYTSETSVASRTQETTAVELGQEFAYGVTDRFSIGVGTTLSEDNWFDESEWGALSLAANYRLYDGDLFKVDVFGGYAMDPVWGDHMSFMDKDATLYGWTVGAQAGYTSGNLTLAGHVAFDYVGDESFNWDEDGIHSLRAGVTGFLALNRNWGLLADVEYTGFTDREIRNNGSWTGKFGVNYNIDNDMFVAGYMSKEMAHVSSGNWVVENGFGFGAKFGIQF